MFKHKETAIRAIQNKINSRGKVRFHHGFKEPIVQGKKVFEITANTITLGHDVIPIATLSVDELEHLFNTINDYDEFKRYQLFYKEIFY